jgi:hypothetical protein
LVRDVQCCSGYCRSRKILKRCRIQFTRKLNDWKLKLRRDTTKYNAADIKKLEGKLKEANYIIEELNKPH